jgi:hypothetical protein
MKDSLGGLFIDPSTVNGNYAKQIVNTFVTGTNIIDWIVANSASEYSLTNPPLITNKTHFLTLCRLPTNYFEYTPYRGIDGLGPFTYDATVGHPHGWTNSYTATGGTNFPAGRTNWYTTDYGFEGLMAVTNLLVFQDCNVIPASTTYRGAIGDSEDWYKGASGSVWSVAIAESTNGWPSMFSYNHTIQPMQMSIGSFSDYGDYYYYDCHVYTKDVGISRKSGVSTNLTIPGPLAIYVITNATGNYDFIWRGSTNATFDALDTSFSVGKNIVTGSVSVAGATRGYGYGYTFTNPPPRYCDDPSTFTSHDSVRGWQGVDSTYWYITPDFKFR